MSTGTGEFNAEGAPTYTLPNYQHREAIDTGGITLGGHFSTYPGSGYIVDIPLYETEAHTLIHDLWNYAWLDSKTRAVYYF